MSFKVRNRFIAAILVLALGIGLVGVGHINNKRIREEEEGLSNKSVQTVYFWYSESRFTDFFTAAAVAFHEKNKDIRVIPVLVEGTEYLERINEASLGGEDFPDAFLLSNDSLEKAYLAGLASKTRDNASVLNTEYFPKSSLDAVSYDGDIIAYPLYFETCVMMYNKTYLAEWADKVNAGQTGEYGEYTGEIDPSEIDDINPNYGEEEIYDPDGEMTIIKGDEDDVSEKTAESYVPKTFVDIMDFGESYEAPAEVEAVLKWDVTDIFYNYLFVGNYLSVGGDSGDDSKNINIDNVDVANCLTVYQNMNQYFSIDTETSAYDTMLDEFLEGKFVYTMVTSDAIEKTEASIRNRTEKMLEELGKEDGEITNIYEFGYCNIPDVADVLKARSLSVTNAVSINGYSECKDAANAFATFLTTEYAEDLYSKTGKIPAASIIGSDNDAVNVFKSEYSKSIPLPKIVEASNLWVQMEITFTEIWNGADIMERLSKLNEQIKSQISMNK